VPQVVQRQAAGVGLFRSEFLFLARRTLPSEEEQVGTYRKLLTLLRGRPATVRTFDLRPDKLAHGSHLTSAAAGPLDWRLVLESTPLQNLFKEQVRAILRAGTTGPVRILVPLINRTEQLDFVLRTLDEARGELNREGLEFDAEAPLGIMLEAAAATTMVEWWAEQVDFLALGTNDLAASALGVDRDDPVAAGQSDPLHPGVLRLIHAVVQAAHQCERPVSVCGEMAATPDGALALAALQVDALSVAVQQLDTTREALAGPFPEAVAELRTPLLRQRTAEQVRKLLRQWSRRRI
jgi:phosphoenolpyruvate-protein kinase (PTS system EI component)